MCSLRHRASYPDMAELAEARTFSAKEADARRPGGIVCGGESSDNR